MEYKLHQLKNGIRLLHVPSTSTIAHACFLINAGSRDEQEHEMGLAHFIEHLIFKHTEKRNTNQILNRLESVGADLNAYTTKEYTCVHASFLTAYVDRTLDLLNDILFHSIFAKADMDKEKGVILDEIASYLDSPEEAINDDFEDLVFAGHALGHNILGNAQSVSKLEKKQVEAYMLQNYRTDEMVLAVMGNYKWSKLLKLVERYFGEIPENRTTVRKRQVPILLAPKQVKLVKPIVQSHYMMGTSTYSLQHRLKTALLLFNNWFGGMGMSSVLNLQIREKYGIAYTIESNYSAYSDTGLFAIYFGTDAEKTKKALQLIQKEIKKLHDKPMGTLQLYRAQQKFIGQIALAEENRIGLLISMAKSLIDYGQIDSLSTVFEKIRQVTTDDISQIVADNFQLDNWSSLWFCPED